MKILALEFSSPARGVAVAIDGAVRSEASECGGRTTHAFTLIEQVLRESGVVREEIECIAVGVGPGSYAGIRTAIAIAQGWQLARGVKLLGISSADVLAAQITGGGTPAPFSIAIDAQRQELFFACYESTEAGAHLVSPFHLAGELDWARLESGEVCYRPDVIGTDHQGMVALAPSSASLARVAATRNEFQMGNELEPIYLRPAAFVKATQPRFGPV